MAIIRVGSYSSILNRYTTATYCRRSSADRRSPEPWRAASVVMVLNRPKLPSLMHDGPLAAAPRCLVALPRSRMGWKLVGGHLARVYYGYD